LLLIALAAFTMQPTEAPPVSQLDNSKAFFRRAFGGKNEKAGDDILVAEGPPSFTDDEKGVYIPKEEEGDEIGEVFTDGPRLIDLGVDGKERPIGKSLSTIQGRYLCSNAETDADYSNRLVSLEDDPTLPVFTFRMWFLALGLSCFGSVLGQIFVSS
jgi:hypothetical protein